MLRLVNMDVTNEDHVRHAVEYVAENLPAGQQGKEQPHNITFHYTSSFVQKIIGSLFVLA